MLRLAGINKNSLVDGEGVRFVLFTQGCSHHCKGCFNKHTWSYSGGETYSLPPLLKQIKENKIITGITYSGGECFEQASYLCFIAWYLKNVRPELTHWAYTGYTWEELLSRKKYAEIEFLKLLDVLVDGKFEEDKKDEDLIYCGSSNQRVIDVQSSLEKGKVILWKR